MLGEERKEGNAGVSNSNKSSNAEQFLPVPSWSVEPTDRALFSSSSSGR